VSGVQPLEMRRRELAVTAETYARDFAIAANAGRLPRRAEKVVVVIAHSSSPFYAVLQTEGLGSAIDNECWCAVLDAAEWGVEPFEPGHVGLAFAIGNDVENRAVSFRTGALS